MTEAKWLTSNDPTPMLELLAASERTGRQGLTLRKARLFAVSCCRYARGQLKLYGLDIFDVAERFADGLVDGTELRILRTRLDQIVRFASSSVLNAIRTTLFDSPDPHQVAADAIRGVDSNTTTQITSLTPLIRDIFGNPFRPITFDPSWLTSSIVSLARQMYESRDFSPMPILADALQDTGCDNVQILDHCRGEGVHVRGCFAIDLILKKK